MTGTASSIAVDASLALFKAAMRQLVATVTIVSTVSDGRRSGMTATAVTSLCAEPPSLLVCVNRSASIHPTLTPGTRFCVNILGRTHADLSMAFGGKEEPEVRFARGAWTADAHCVPYLADARANVFCTIEKLVDHGTHSIIIGNAYAVMVGDRGPSLIYGNGAFLDLATVR